MQVLTFLLILFVVKSSMAQQSNVYLRQYWKLTGMQPVTKRNLTKDWFSYARKVTYLHVTELTLNKMSVNDRGMQGLLRVLNKFHIFRYLSYYDAQRTSRLILTAVFPKSKSDLLDRWKIEYTIEPFKTFRMNLTFLSFKLNAALQCIYRKEAEITEYLNIIQYQKTDHCRYENNIYRKWYMVDKKGSESTDVMQYENEFIWNSNRKLEYWDKISGKHCVSEVSRT